MSEASNNAPCCKSYNEILKKMELMRQDIENLHRNLDTLIASVDILQTSVSALGGGNVKNEKPFKTADDFINWNTELNEEKEKDRLLKEMKKIIDPDERNAVRRILKAWLSDDAAIGLSYCGKQEKYNFHKTQFYEILKKWFEIRFPEVNTENSLKEIITNYLTNAQDKRTAKINKVNQEMEK